MRFKDGNTLPNLGSRINWQLVTLVGGLVVAVSAGALAGAFERDGSRGSTAMARSAEVPASRPLAADAPSTPSEMVYIILGSEAEAAALRTAINTYTAALPELAASTSNTHIIALENREQEAYFNSALSLSSELAAFGIGQRVIDLREKAQRTIQAGAEGFGAGAPAEGIIYVVGSSAEKLALEQQIKALVEDGRRRSVILLDGPDGDRLYNLMAAEQMANGGFEVVDLRN